MFRAPEKYRYFDPAYPKEVQVGNNGIFIVRIKGEALRMIASDGLGWEHVSASYEHRTPTWDEMCWIKKNFWGPEDCVVQYHPPESDYVSCHPYCLHLWRPVGIVMPRPPSIMVGPKV